MGIHQHLLAAGGPFDPFWDDVVLLVVADTPFQDVSQYANALTTFGGAVLDSTQSIVGGQSIYCPNPPADSGLTFNGSQAHFNFGTGSWTIEMFRYIPTGTANAFSYRLNTSTGNQVASFLSSSSHTISFRVGGSVVSSVSGYAFEGNVWRHEALVYDADSIPGSTIVSFFCGGFRYFSNTYVNGVGLSLSGSCALGNRFAAMTAPLDGWWDQLRITAGVPRYSGATYQIPTPPFPRRGPP